MNEPRAGVKSASAFRTISEVSNELGVPQHVLRFWETKFAQVKPLKRGGGRRYYRPEDIALLKRIQGLLYDEGYTIKGVQRLFKDGRVKAGAKAKAPAPQERAAEAADRGPQAAHAQSGTAETPKVTVVSAGEKPVDELRALLQDLTEARDLLRRMGNDS